MTNNILIAAAGVIGLIFLSGKLTGSDKVQLVQDSPYGGAWITHGGVVVPPVSAQTPMITYNIDLGQAPSIADLRGTGATQVTQTASSMPASPQLQSFAVGKAGGGSVVGQEVSGGVIEATTGTFLSKKEIALGQCLAPTHGSTFEQMGSVNPFTGQRWLLW